MSRIGRRGVSGSRLAHLAAWAIVASLLFTLIGSALPSGAGLTPALAVTNLQKAKLDKLAKQQADAETDLEETKIRIERVQTKIDGANADLDRLRERLGARLGEMYKNRGSDALDVLNVVFSGEDTSINAVLEHLTMVTHVAQSDASLIDDVKGRVHELNTLRAELRTEKAMEQQKTAKFDAAR